MSKTILATDDSSTVRQLLEKILTTAGFTVVDAENGAVGLERCQEVDVDLFLIDVNMPEMDGLEMTRRVRALEQYASTPIFILTTESDPATARNGRDAGATAWIVKPVDAELLLEGIQAVLGAA